MKAVAPGEVRVHWADTANPAIRSRIEEFRTWMSADERAREERFLFEHLRRDFVLARALVRATLSQYANVPPAAWRFEIGSHGRPHVASPITDVAFNLSHTEGRVVCAVSLEPEVGIDIESTTARVETVTVAESFFAPPEVAALGALPAAAQIDRFFAYWTLKESYIKARGLGLAIPLDSFWFDVAEDTASISFDARTPDDPSRWHFTRKRLSDRHVVAVAVAQRVASPPTIRFERESDLLP